MLNATVTIPWRPSPSRMEAFECVMRYWEAMDPIDIITADSDSEIFSLSQARNNGVRQAQSDVVVVADADTVVLPRDNVNIAVNDPVGITWPHAVWRLIPGEYAERPVDQFPQAPVLTEYDGGLGGCIIATTEEWWRLGGQPEEFDGWGHEDRAFHLVTMTLSTHRRIGGVAYSIEHNQNLKQADSPGWNRDSRRNRELVRPYENAAGKPWLMRELLKIRNEPLPDGRDDWRTRLGVYDPVRRELFKQQAKQPPPRRPGWRERAAQR